MMHCCNGGLQVHSAPVTVMRYNAVHDTVISSDEKGAGPVQLVVGVAVHTCKTGDLCIVQALDEKSQERAVWASVAALCRRVDTCVERLQYFLIVCGLLRMSELPGCVTYARMMSAGTKSDPGRVLRAHARSCRCDRVLVGHDPEVPERGGGLPLQAGH